jgi:hyaluronan synthase
MENSPLKKITENSKATQHDKKSMVYSSVIPVDPQAIHWAYRHSREQLGGFKKVNRWIKTNQDKLVMGATLLVLALAAIGWFWFSPVFEQQLLRLTNSDTFNWFTAISLSLLALKVAFLGFLFWNNRRYKPVASVSDTELPVISVIVPAYNEGKQVWETLHSLVNSDYPAEKLEIITIDDGSEDDTWTWMLRAKNELGERIQLYKQAHNAGKRQALYRGFKQAKGSIFVTVDSDSLVKADTLRQLVSPFVVDPQCGAVAGNVKVLNKQKAFIPRMLEVSFAFSFEFVRAAQSNLGSVLCTPGALSAYRKTAVMRCLPAWINQQFMGQPSDIGEDRAMTNMIMKQGYTIRFQQNAKVLTQLPEKYRGLYRMFIRWERSNVRENLMMSRFAFGQFRPGKQWGARILLLNQWMHMLTAYPALLALLVLLFIQPALLVLSTLTGILAFSSLPALFYAWRNRSSEALWAYVYSVFYAFGLFWVTPYAMATAARRGWLTRSLADKSLQQAA